MPANSAPGTVAGDNPASQGGNKIGLILGFALSLALLLAFAFALDWQSFLEEFAKVRWRYVPLFFLVYYFGYWIRAWRWKYLLPQKNVSLTTLYDAFAAGALATFLLPFRVGELVRAIALNRWQGTAVAAGFASVVLERMFDVLTLLYLLGISCLLIPQAPAGVTNAALALGVTAFVIFLGVLASYFCSEQLLALLRRVLALFFFNKAPALQERIFHFASGIVQGLRAIDSWRSLALVLLSSLGVWLTFAFYAQVAFWCMGEFPSFFVGLLTTLVIALAVALPSAPGFLGTFHFGCWAVLTGVFGYSKEFALAYGVVSHSLQMILGILFGFRVLQRRGMGLKELRG